MRAVFSRALTSTPPPKKYPIKADYKGISLSTSINENVAVIFEKGNDRAILE